MKGVDRLSAHLSAYTTLDLGGWCPDVIRTDSARHIPELFEELDEEKTDLLGGGSNVVISDAGVSGPVVVLESAHSSIRIDDDGIVNLDAALPWAAIAEELSARNVAGLESLVGIPGTVGGAIVQNVGAYGYELAGRVVSIVAYDRKLRTTRKIDPKDCGFGYRTSSFKGSTKGDVVVLSALLQLEPDGLHEPRYEELERQLADSIGRPSTGRYRPRDVMAAVLTLREGKSAVFHRGDPQTRSAGSFFVNPVVSEDEFNSIRDRSSDRSGVPHWVVGEDQVKVSAGWLVERSGFPRGFRDGRVALSRNHALSIVNLDRCSSAELIAFAGRIRCAVGRTFGVWMTPEPVFLGFEQDELIENGLISPIRMTGVAQ
jgi:UDP-N-acetylmuramate dehydrogenase